MTSKALFQKISEISKRTNLKAYVVGGYVRDQLLKAESKDIDFVVIGDGIAFAKAVKKALKASNFVVYNRFGTAKISIGDFELEFVGARKESYSENSRKPNVEPTDLETDLSRRDFSINAMAIDVTDENIRIIDPFNGQMALQNEVLITPLDPLITFEDDPLRILRAIRFATRLNFTIEPRVFSAMQKKVQRLSIVSEERIMDELSKTIAHANAKLAFELLEKSSVLEIIFPPFKGSATKITQFFASADYSSLSLEERFAICCLLANVKNEDIDSLFRKLKFSNQQIKEIMRNSKLTLIWQEKLEATFSDSDIRHFLYEAANKYKSVLSFASIYGINFDLKSTLQRCKEIDQGNYYSNFQLAIDGKKLMSLRPDLKGKEIGDFIKKLIAMVLDGKLENKAQALQEIAEKN